MVSIEINDIITENHLLYSYQDLLNLEYQGKLTNHYKSSILFDTLDISTIYLSSLHPSFFISHCSTIYFHPILPGTSMLTSTRILPSTHPSAIEIPLSSPPVTSFPSLSIYSSFLDSSPVIEAFLATFRPGHLSLSLSPLES